MKYKNELDDFVRGKLQDRQPAFSPQAWQEAQQMLETVERETDPRALWAWWMVVVATFLLSAYVFLPGATQPEQPSSPVQELAAVVHNGALPERPSLQLSQAITGQKATAAAQPKGTNAVITKPSAAQKLRLNRSTSTMNTPSSTTTQGGTAIPTLVQGQAAPKSATPAESAIASTTTQKAASTTSTKDKMQADARIFLANQPLSTVTVASSEPLPNRAKAVDAIKRQKPNPFGLSIIGGLSMGQMNNSEGLQRNVISPLLGAQLDYTLWRNRGMRFGIGLAAMIQSYQNMQHQSLIKRSLYYDFGYSKTTQWIDVEHLSMLSTPLLLHFQVGPHRVSTGPSILWRLSYAQSVNERKETNFGLVSSSTAMMDQNLEQAGFLTSRNINEQSLVSYAPKLHHLAWHLRYELQFARRWSIGAATTLGASDWVENNIGQDFWMSGQGFLKFHF